MISISSVNNLAAKNDFYYKSLTFEEYRYLVELVKSKFWPESSIHCEQRVERLPYIVGKQ